MSNNKATVIKEFSPLTTTVSFYRPQDSIPEHATEEKSPSLVVLCSWMGAAPKYIAKYTQGYQKQFPHAALLLIQCPIADIFQSNAAAQKNLRTASDTIMDAYEQHPTRPILLHAFSNGGATMALHLARSLRARMPLDRAPRLPFRAYIFDCLPGKPDLEQAVLAFTIGLRARSARRILAAAVLRLVLFCYMLVLRAFRLPDVLTRLRDALNDRAVFDAAAPRLYLFSRADRLVRFEHVREHVADAVGKGFGDVREEAFETSAHCALLVEDAARYWAAVRDLVGRVEV